MLCMVPLPRFAGADKRNHSRDALHTSSLRGANGSGPKWPADDRLRDEAIQTFAAQYLDCFASLAMTK